MASKRQQESEAEIRKRKKLRNDARASLSVRADECIVSTLLNPQKPRKKSFDITLVDGEVCLWSGITRGPPARLKFPEPAVVVSALEDALKTDVEWKVCTQASAQL
ncbi:selenoprotein H-like isoform X2 [Osmerus eperlanus]|uniref:selenoprotein H-like isoform X2 n=1 Tax=Osmerus eperlanus TaxID=29151 RepID=UPI002E10389E